MMGIIRESKSRDTGNKNTRTLGAGDYPAFEFILKVHGKVNFLSLTIKSL